MALSLVDLIEDAARDYGDRIALSMAEGGSITYSELERASRAVARELVIRGVAKGDRVGLVTPKNLYAIAGLWGAMRAGAAYVPIDPQSPPSRAALIAGDCRMKAVLVAEELIETVAGIVESVPEIEVVKLDGQDGLLGCDPARVPHPISDCEMPSANVRDLAYILYTSGSTGVPKGVMVSHGAALSFAEWGARRFALSSNDVFSSHAPLHFDLSTFDFFASCLAGAQVVILDEETVRFPIACANVLESAGITVWYSVPRALRTMLRMGRLVQRDLKALHTVLFAGEPYPADELHELQAVLPGVELFNLYGPTETNVCTYWQVPAKGTWHGSSIPIGVDCSNCEGVVVDEKLEPVPDGTTGELLMRGGTLMEGYWGDPEKTERSFVSDFRYPHLSDRFFRTGDLVARQSDGNYSFFGRADHMVKIRGYRVELGEVEAALYQHEGVAEVAVVAAELERGADHELVAFIVGDNGFQDESESRVALKKVLDGVLPKYMVPTKYRWLANLPLTSTGKVDRQGLLKMVQEESGKGGI